MLTLKRMILCPRKREAIILTAEKDQIKGLIDAKNNHFKNMLCNKRMYQIPLDLTFCIPFSCNQIT